MPDNISGKIVGESSPPIVSEYYSPKNDFGEHRILYDGKYKYMQYEYKKAPELYDLEQDGRELVNLAEKRPEIVLEMETKLKDWQKAHRPRHSQSTQPKAPLSQDAIEGLKALGYIQ
jgi:arylsulfatase A-like enzyme